MILSLHSVENLFNWELLEIDMAKYKVQGIGKFVKNLIQTTKLSNSEILTKVKEQFPEAQTSMACIAWYQTDLRKKVKVEEPKALVLTDEQFEEEFKVE